MDASLLLSILITAFSCASALFYLMGLTIKKSNKDQGVADATMRHFIGGLSIITSILSLILIFGFTAK